MRVAGTAGGATPGREDRPRAIRRTLHPGAWWGWALGCAVVASRTTNPVLLALLIALVGLTVVAKRSDAGWAKAFRLYVYLAVFIVVMRIVFRVVFGADGPTVLVPLPRLALPGFLSSVRLFGPVSAEALLWAVQSGLQLAAMILAIGAANVLANPKRLLAAVPSVLYEWGTVVIIALTVFPQLAESLVRVGRARQLRAETGRGVHLIRNVAMPVLSDSLDRSLRLAGAMDSRGYGRVGQVSATVRRTTAVLILLGTLAICVGAYGLLDTGATSVWLGAPMIVIGVVVGVAALRLSGRRASRTRYRPDRMRAREGFVIASAVAAMLAVFLLGATQPGVLHTAFPPLRWPEVSFAALAAVMVLALPILVAPDLLSVGRTVPRRSSRSTLADDGVVGTDVAPVLDGSSPALDPPGPPRQRANRSRAVASPTTRYRDLIRDERCAR